MNPLAVPVIALELGLGVTEAGAPSGDAAPLLAEDRYDAAILASSERSRLDPALVKAVMRVESDFRPAAVSPRGARGLMQVMPATAAELGVPEVLLGEPRPNVRAGTVYLALLYRAARREYGLRATRLRDAPPWVRRRVLAAYHGGPRLLAAARWPGATRRYVDKVDRLARDPVSALRAPRWRPPLPQGG